MKKYRLIEALKEKFTLIVSLPMNDPELALAVQKAGADAIKVHLNCHHRASGTLFGTWDEERKRIESIPSMLDIPVGIVPGAETVASMAEMESLKQLGFDFLDIFAHHIPPPFFSIEGMSKAIALDYTFPFELIPGLEALGMEIIESSVIHPDGYGKPLNGRDLANYQALITKARVPVFMPTQRKVTLPDVPFLSRVGFSGIAIGAVVTGKNFVEIAAVTGQFRHAMDQVEKKRI